MLNVDDLYLSYGKVNAVRGVSLHAKAGEVTLILGANGAGKTTTLRGICGLHEAKSGQIHLEGVSLVGLNPAKIVRKGLVMVPEGRRVFGSLSVLENLKMGGYVASKSDAAQTLEYVYELFPILRERESGPAGLLSGGEQQMLAFGRALMSQPRVVLMDEPSMGLAPTMVETVLASARAIADTGIAVLMVEQNADAAMQIANDVVIIDRGEVAYTGDARQAEAQESVVRAFLGEAVLTEE
jgi:branched-chain amino acid transport system ATP-binding protein